MIIIIIIIKNCCAGTSPRLGRCGGNSPRLIKCNCLAGSRVTTRLTRYRGEFRASSLREY